MPNKSDNYIHAKWTQFIVGLENCETYSRGSAVLANLCREMCKAVSFKVKELLKCILLLQASVFTRIHIISLVSPLPPTYPYAAR